jgi:hypothetical protein
MTSSRTESFSFAHTTLRGAASWISPVIVIAYGSQTYRDFQAVRVTPGVGYVAVFFFHKTSSASQKKLSM